MFPLTFVALIIVSQYFCNGLDSDEDLTSLRNVVVVVHGGLHSLDGKQIYKNLKNPFAEPVGELTTRGKQQGTEIGFALRKRYGAFINNYTYNPYEYRWINGGEQNRTYATSLLIAAGLFPPTLEYEIWNPELLWQPVPVHENPKLGTMGAFLLTIRKDCSSLEWVTKTEGFEKLLLRYNDYIETICKWADTPYTNIRYAFVASTAIGILSHYPQFLPNWANETIVKTAHQFYFDVYDFLFSFKEVIRLAAGYLLELIIKEWRDHLDFHMQRKMLGFAVHDDTIAPLVAAVTGTKDFPENWPKFASFATFELHEKNGNNFVRAYYWYNATDGPNRIKILDCADPCTLSKFETRSEEFIPIDWAVECGETEYLDQADTNTGLFIIFTVLFCILAVVFFSWWCFERKELKKLRNLHSEFNEDIDLSNKPNYESVDNM